ncbi:aminotransferase class V-fold PLP-dependent enzyme [Limnochorda pilosa]|nr:aminotransferase class V-fold PLP-dependent enzyme [Limnochorda pilosa]
MDHAATSWPKPPEVLKAMIQYLEESGGNPGRSGHRLSVAAGRIIYETREAVAELLGVRDPLRVIFTLNATHAINLVLRATLRPGDRVVVTGMEHNAVMRPLRAMAVKHGIQVVVAPAQSDGSTDVAQVGPLLQPKARLLVAAHASNVTGTLAPMEELSRLAHAAGALVLADAAQTVGAVPIGIGHMGADFLVFSGHKGLLGPPGTGGVALGDGVDATALEPLILGGTGSRSESEEPPAHLPDRFEVGTPNGVGLAGLGAGVRWVQSHGVEELRAREMSLRRQLVEGLKTLRGVVVHGPRNPADATAVVSFTVLGRSVSEIGSQLDERFGILCRVGLHCAPRAHRSIGTYPEGTVRLSPGPFIEPADIDAVLSALRQVVARS